MNHIPLENLPRLDFCLWRFTGISERIAEFAKRSLVPAKANLLPGFNFNPFPISDCADRRDAHSKNSNSHKNPSVFGNHACSFACDHFVTVAAHWSQNFVRRVPDFIPTVITLRWRTSFLYPSHRSQCIAANFGNR